ncbi:uncharacterized protein LOC121732675 [Aricia agestis]|uniref:uncharacterized protein LOC121732675 n=1 Tax=Aricia agestis TaxID=91739 RepID=UPI001C20A562|nr:uncharacterized protein LOC121732675 [Aricia agestis]
MYGVFTNVLWYIEFVFMAILITGFFCLVLYIGNSNYSTYNAQFDMRRRFQNFQGPQSSRFPKNEDRNIDLNRRDTRPICCDLGCIWFCSLIGSVAIIAVCYWGAYTFISETNLKFGLFVP